MLSMPSLTNNFNMHEPLQEPLSGSVHLIVPPALGQPVPCDPHAISVQLPTWDSMVGLGSHDPRITKIQKAGYPRSFLHPSVVEMSNICRGECKSPLDACLLFAAYEYAFACKEFIAKSQINDNGAKGHIASIEIEKFAFYQSTPTGEPDFCLFAILLPEDLYKQGLIFWRLVGVGISSRLAKKCLTLHPRWIPKAGNNGSASMPFENGNINDAAIDEAIRTRIANLYGRASIRPATSEPVRANDCFLYQTGMAAIYHAHHLALQLYGAESVIFGFPYELTLKMMEMYGPSCKFFGFGTNAELDEFEEYLKLNKIQAVWCECASNPLLRTVDLARIRCLADQYGFIVVVDDTIGSVANVDVLGVADMIVTSLTKSFSGYANVMGGSIILNPGSQHYSEMQKCLAKVYRSFLFREDARQLEINSRDYLHRSGQANNTASCLVRALLPFVGRTGSPFTAIYYPEICWSTQNYRQLMRGKTEDYTPGFGSLFTIDLADVDIAAVFFDALNVHKGPSLGAQYTLAQPYIQTVFQKEKSWAAQYGLKESIVRISVGLESQEVLVKEFCRAATIADQAYGGRCVQAASLSHHSKGTKSIAKDMLGSASFHMNYTKCHTDGNDFLMIEASHLSSVREMHLSKLASSICNRRTGIGADGLLVVSLEDGIFTNEVKIQLFNSDSSQAEISGNGTCCVAAFALWKGLRLGTIPLFVNTSAGKRKVKLVEQDGSLFRFVVDMGIPVLEETNVKMHLQNQDPVEVTLVNVGNPQCALFDVTPDWKETAKDIQASSRFPAGVNVSFSTIRNTHTLSTLFFERGAGETPSSGTGSIGAAVSAIQRGLAETPVTVETANGSLTVHWAGAGTLVQLEGHAQVIGHGTYLIPEKVLH